MPSTLISRVLTSAALALGASLLTSSVALAAPPGWTPNPGDNRASAHAGNVTTCAAAGLPGDTVTWPNLEDPTNTYVTISANDVPIGETIVAVVVKGGPGYNVYQGLTSWTALHSPINVGGQIPVISHWFACVTRASSSGGGSTTTTTTTANSGSMTTTSSGPSNAIGVAGSSGPTVGTAGNTTNSPNTKNLAYTGVGNAWLIWVGVLLLLLGACVVALPRLARRRS
jgi:hypothetical protein